MTGETLKVLRRTAEETKDRQAARLLYDQLKDIAAQLERRFNFGKVRKRR
jgi:hypothetical protein